MAQAVIEVDVLAEIGKMIAELPLEQQAKVYEHAAKLQKACEDPLFMLAFALVGARAQAEADA